MAADSVYKFIRSKFLEMKRFGTESMAEDPPLRQTAGRPSLRAL